MNHWIRHEQFSKLFPILFKTTIWRICYYVFLFGTDCFIQLQGLLKNKDRKLAETFNSNFRHIDDALSLRNSRLGEYLHHIYPNDRFSSYFDYHIIIDNRGRLKTKLYDKRDDVTFPTVIFPFIGNNIPPSPTYGIDISQLVHFSRACVRYSNFWTKLSN